MIIEINKDNIDDFKIELISINAIKKDLNNNPFGHYLCYVENNVIIGYLYYSDIYDRAEINQIEIEFIHRKCGKASELIDKLIKTVEKSITLEVKINNFPAIHLYEKFGFKKIGIRKGYYDGIDAILMERK